MDNLEIEILRNEQEYWKEIENFLPWRLMGWTYKHHATFITPNGNHEDTLSINGTQFDQLMNALRDGRSN